MSNMISETEMSQQAISFTFTPKSSKKSRIPDQVGDSAFEPGNIPRISKLMALAIRFEGLVKCGEVKDYADLARLGGVHAPESHKS